jgi:predicted nucleotidyltransferase
VPAPIDLPKNSLTEFCQRHHVRRLSLFGSALRDDFGPRSDVDFVVEFEPGVVVGYLKLAEMEMELASLLGRKVDLRTPGELSRYFRDQVMATAEPLYVS